MDWVVRRALILVPVLLALLAGRAGASGPNYLSLAQQGVADVRAHWWNADSSWYNDTYNGQPPSMPLARLWSAYPLIEC